MNCCREVDERFQFLEGEGEGVPRKGVELGIFLQNFLWGG